MDENKAMLDSLTEEDIKYLSTLALSDDELSGLISLIDLVPVENKEIAFSIIKTIFEGKQLVTIESEETEEEKVETDDSTEEIEDVNNVSIAESYTRILLGNR